MEIVRKMEKQKSKIRKPNSQLITIFQFNHNYFILTVLLFLTEVFIDLYVEDSFIRPYFGDFLVVILLYCFLKSFIKVSVFVATSVVLLFSFAIETAQYFNIIENIGIQDVTIARVIIGNSFSWIDLVAYCLGIVTVLIIEKIIRSKQ